MGNNLRVLMYHRTIPDGTPDLLTVTAEQLEDQFKAIKKEGYNCVTVNEIIHHIMNGTPLKENAILLTFDDGYKNNLTVLYPLLKKHELRALIFLVPGYTELANSNKSGEYLTIDDIRSMDPQTIEYGLHTFNHESYNTLDLTAIEADIIKTKNWFHTHEVKYEPALAYTYGEFPKRNKNRLNALFKLFEKHDIQAAFNIGNRVNILPIQKKFVIQRIDVRGTETLNRFISKVRTGKPITGLIKDLLRKP
ncbi:polysaccharide deacetylase family protein [Terrimonas alba]|uniref:polysaccharide deacetylase family protein n=1 Tax=Terrimonas alba TaxID=3349636 RepID=UPI0035F2D2A8